MRGNALTMVSAPGVCPLNPRQDRAGKCATVDKPRPPSSEKPSCAAGNIQALESNDWQGYCDISLVGITRPRARPRHTQPKGRGWPPYPLSRPKKANLEGETHVQHETAYLDLDYPTLEPLRASLGKPHRQGYKPRPPGTLRDHPDKEVYQTYPSTASARRDHHERNPILAASPTQQSGTGHEVHDTGL